MFPVWVTTYLAPASRCVTASIWIENADREILYSSSRASSWITLDPDVVGSSLKWIASGIAPRTAFSACSWSVWMMTCNPGRARRAASATAM